MTGKKRQNPCHLTQQTDDRTYVATWPTMRLRFLLADGTTIDVITTRDDSDLRERVLETTGTDRIEGVARVLDLNAEGRSPDELDRSQPGP